MTSEAERLRERVADTAMEVCGVIPFVNEPKPGGSRQILAAIVDELGITEARLRMVDKQLERTGGMHVGVSPDLGAVRFLRDVCHTLLEASR